MKGKKNCGNGIVEIGGKKNSSNWFVAIDLWQCCCQNGRKKKWQLICGNGVAKNWRKKNSLDSYSKKYPYSYSISVSLVFLTEAVWFVCM